MVTTYTTDQSGNPNQSFHYLNYVDTASICREYFFNNLKARFSQSRLTNGTLIPRRSIENEESVRAEFAKIYEELAQLTLTVAGSGATIFFKENLDVKIDLAQRKVTSTFKLPIVSQLGDIIATAQLNFNFQEA
jgi:phage tail sheath gpL-like